MSLETEITDKEIFSEEDLPESAAQAALIQYLIQVLQWLYHIEGWFISTNLAIVYTPRRYLAPDVALFKGLVLTPVEEVQLKSYRLRQPNRPAPAVVFEVSSEDTWTNDLNDKPEQYRQLGAREYFAYDPHTPQVWRGASTRLRGWRYRDNQVQEIWPDERGWLWSEELESWLVPEGSSLTLYDREGNRRLTEVEYQRRAKEAERRAKEAERRAKEAERRAKEAEREAKEAAWQKLRELGFDPENL